MILLQFAILFLCVLLLVRSINHDNRMEKMERFMGKIVKSIRGVEQHTGLMQDPIYNADYANITEEVEETDDIQGT